MAEFLNPFSTAVPGRKLTDLEMRRALRQSIVAEHEAIALYMAYAESTDNPLVKKVMVDVANEEREHVGEFQKLLSILAPDEDMYVAHGVEEVEEMAAEVAGEGEAEEDDEDGAESAGEPEIPTIGDIKED
jgi:rubrerythrin